MVKTGDLNQFVKDLRDRLEPKKNDRKNRNRDVEDEVPRQRDRDEVPRYRGEVKTITGGTILDRCSETARKRYARQVYNLYQHTPQVKQPLAIMFTEEDYDDVIWPHEDPLVVNPIIG